MEMADDYSENEHEDYPEEINIEEIFTQMPVGYRLIFNLYVFEEKNTVRLLQFSISPKEPAKAS